MKSGKADEFSMQGKVEPKENNKVQMLLYMAVLEYSMGQDRRRMHPYLLYTRYPLLYPARASWAQVRRVINLRNRIVAAEYGVQFHNHPDFTRNLLAQINPEVVNERKLSGRFWEQYLKPLSRVSGRSCRRWNLWSRPIFIRFIISLQKNFIPPNREMWIMKDVQGLQLFG